MAHAAIEALLKRASGIDAASVGAATIDHAVRRRMLSYGLTSEEAYLEKLQRGVEELQELIELVVVPETWFFRGPEAFTTLVKIVMTEWLPAHPSGELMLLSIPCATGEEPYSIAIALVDAGLPLDRFKVDAVDISKKALAKARQGCYDNNAFRNQDLSFRDRYFRPVSNKYMLADSIRSQVTFDHGNLLDHVLPLGGRAYHAIFCRNVLIYFDHLTQKRVMKTLKHLLSPDGLLFVGPAEGFLAQGSGFCSTRHPMALSYRPASVIPEIARDSPPPKIHKPKRVVYCKTISQTERAGPHRPTQRDLPVAARLARETELERANSLASGGRLREAAEVCEAHLREAGASADAYFFLGLVRDKLGDAQLAMTSYRKALYMNPNHVEALLHFALLMEKQGDLASARRLRHRARRAGGKA